MIVAEYRIRCRRESFLTEFNLDYEYDGNDFCSKRPMALHSQDFFDDRSYNWIDQERRERICKVIAKHLKKWAIKKEFGIVLRRYHPDMKPKFLMGEDKALYESLVKNGGFELNLKPVLITVQQEFENDEDSEIVTRIGPIPTQLPNLLKNRTKEFVNSVKSDEVSIIAPIVHFEDTWNQLGEIYTTAIERASASWSQYGAIAIVGRKK